MKKLVTAIALVMTSGFVLATDQAVIDQYNKSCVACHASGAAGAPKTGDADAWNVRLSEKGMETMVANAKNGINAMPPKGMCFDCSDEDFQALIEHMMQP
ncbi:MAG: c-type cytochrome [Pseudomonadales bacterium]